MLCTCEMSALGSAKWLITARALRHRPTHVTHLMWDGFRSGSGKTTTQKILGGDICIFNVPPHPNDHPHGTKTHKGALTGETLSRYSKSSTEKIQVNHVRQKKNGQRGLVKKAIWRGAPSTIHCAPSYLCGTHLLTALNCTCACSPVSDCFTTWPCNRSNANSKPFRIYGGLVHSTGHICWCALVEQRSLWNVHETF